MLEVAQNILAFLKDNCTREGHTYWLFRRKGEDVVKLYDLTSLTNYEVSHIHVAIHVHWHSGIVTCKYVVSKTSLLVSPCKRCPLAFAVGLSCRICKFTLARFAIHSELFVCFWFSVVLKHSTGFTFST